MQRGHPPSGIRWCPLPLPNYSFAVGSHSKSGPHLSLAQPEIIKPQRSSCPCLPRSWRNRSAQEKQECTGETGVHRRNRHAQASDLFCRCWHLNSDLPHCESSLKLSAISPWYCLIFLEDKFRIVGVLYKVCAWVLRTCYPKAVKYLLFPITVAKGSDSFTYLQFTIFIVSFMGHRKMSHGDLSLTSLLMMLTVYLVVICL